MVDPDTLSKPRFDSGSRNISFKCWELIFRLDEDITEMLLKPYGKSIFNLSAVVNVTDVCLV